MPDSWRRPIQERRTRDRSRRERRARRGAECRRRRDRKETASPDTQTRELRQTRALVHAGLGLPRTGYRSFRQMAPPAHWPLQNALRGLFGARPAVEVIMSMLGNPKLFCIALVAGSLCGCNRGPANDKPEYRSATDAARGSLVVPLKDDTRAEIVSWVDGQVVTDWAAEATKRQQAIDRYLDDSDPDRAHKYGFRSGQNPRLAWNWFRSNPVGFNGVPFVLFKTILDLDPNHENPTLRAIARIWKREAPLPAGPATPARAWTLHQLR